MKVLVSNLSGNVGKTLTAKYLLSPRMANAPIYSVESINSDGSESELIRGKQYGELLEALSLVEDAVVDVGASNIEEFIKLMKQYRGSHEDFDFIVIPTVGTTKQMRDTIATIEAFSEIGIPAKKLRVVFNMIDIDETPERVFSGLFAYHEKEHKFTLRPNAVSCNGISAKWSQSARLHPRAVQWRKNARRHHPAKRRKADRAFSSIAL